MSSGENKMNNSTIRILHILTSLDRGGIETMLMNYYRAIDTNIIQFDFLLHREGEFAYSKEVIERGGIIYSLPHFNPLNINYLNSLDKFFSEHTEYKIVHSHLNCLSAIPLRYAKKHGIPVRIAHSHIIIYANSLKDIAKKILKPLIPFYANYLFACSNQAGKWMFPKHNFYVIKNAIDASKFSYDKLKRNSIRKEMGIENNYSIGHVGRLTSQKNQIFLIELMKILTNDLPEAKLILVGDGEQEGVIKSKIKEYDIEDNIILLNSRNDIADILQGFDIFVFPSLYEGLGIVAIEAQASGLTTLCSEYVPEEVKVTELAKFLPLDKEIWKSEILYTITTKNNRKDTYEEIKEANYDIKTEAIKLQNEYVKMYCRANNISK